MTEVETRTTKPAGSMLLFALGAVLITCSASAGDLTIPNAFTAGTSAVADEVNANFSAVEAAVDDNDARIAAVEATVSTADVFTFMNPDGTPAAGDVVGSAELRRTDAGIRLEADTTMLIPGGAYTLWWVVFNNPAACDPAGCSDADFPGAGGDPAVEASVLNATGRVADANGNATFHAFLPVGFSHTNPASGNIRQPFGAGLQNVDTAEIHVVVRAHGASTGSVEQTSTILGDCVADDGAGNQVCFDPQAIVFPLP